MNRNEPRNGHMGVSGTLRAKKVAIVPDYYGEPSQIKRGENGKYYVEFDEIPALLFISHDGHGSRDQFFIHGDEQIDSKNITIESAPAELTTYHKESYAAVRTVNKEELTQ
ncbi:hypothetical protein [Metabacillus fastidiosus]|uniref:Uncharacterized protein n=1 Tax=Metabacillus fastidiosus TaxID=1458 RepID=A0ABU6NSU0_9BACI|nr:hypothetical protein [Metabacillus fastidiosus]